MRKAYFLILLAALGFSGGVHAQITVTNTTFPIVGDAFQHNIDVNGALPDFFLMPGFNLTWDFSGLQADLTSTTTYLHPSAGTRFADFPTADLLVIDQGREWYYNVTNESVDLLGYYGIDPVGIGINLLFPFLPPFGERRAPMDFFDTNAESSTFLVLFNDSEMPANQLQLLPFTADSFRIRSSISRFDAVDAYGNLSIPGGCYEVLREKRTTYRERRLDAKVPPLGWLDVTDVATQSLGLTLGVDTIVTTHFFSNVDRQEIMVVRLNNSQSAAETIQFKHVSNVQLAISNIATTPESCPNANNGGITVTATGAGTLTYAISGPANQSNSTGVFTGLPDGSYTITVTSSSSPCPVSAMATVVAAGADVVLPTISCPANQTLVLGTNCAAILPNYTSLATVGDNCGVQSVTQFPLAGGTVPGAGTLTVTLAVIDLANNVATCMFTVTKVDNTAPTITCPATQTLALGANCSAVLPDYTNLATGLDDCGVQSVVQSPAPGTTVFSPGNITVTLTATDLNGLTNFCQFTVTKVDSGTPTISCPAPQTLALGANCSTTLPNYTTLANADGSCGVQGVVTQSPAAGTVVSNLGNMTVTLTTTGANGQTNSCQFTVEKVDNTPPTITCPPTQTLLLGANCSAILPNYTSLATTGDNCGVQSVTQSPAPGTTVSGFDDITVTLTATDANNNAVSCTSLVTVTGLPCGWSQTPDGIGCADGNAIDFNPATQVWTATSTGCYYATPFNADEAAFAQRTLCGNGSIMAQVTSLNGAGWAGIVLREGNAPGARKVQLMTNLSSFSRREVRYSTGGTAFPQQFPSQAKYWLRLLRVGQQFVGYVSSNGTHWSQVFALTLNMGQCLEAGLVVTNATSTGTVTATFTNVHVQGSSSLDGGDLSLGLGDNPSPELAVFPNPTSGEVFLDLSSYAGQALTLEVLDLAGRLLAQTKLDSAPALESLDLSAYQAGLYLLRVRAAGQPDQVRRVVRQ